MLVTTNGWESSHYEDQLVHGTAYHDSACSCPPAYHGPRCETAWPTAEPTAAPTQTPTQPAEAPCAATPPSTANVASKMNMERNTGAPMSLDFLDDGVLRVTGATCLEAALCNDCSTASLAAQVATIAEKVAVLESQVAVLQETR